MPTALCIRSNILTRISPVTAAAIIALFIILSGTGAQAQSFGTQSFGDSIPGDFPVHPLSYIPSTEKHPRFAWGCEPEIDFGPSQLERSKGSDPFLLPWHSSDWPSKCRPDYFEDEARGSTLRSVEEETSRSPSLQTPPGQQYRYVGWQWITIGKPKKSRLIDRLQKFEAEPLHSKEELLRLVWSVENKPEPGVNQRQWLGRLYRRAASASPQAVIHEYYLFLAALCEGNIEAARKQAQSAYLRAPGSHQRVVDLFSEEFDGHDLPFEASLIQDFHQLSLYRKPLVQVHYEAAARAIVAHNREAAWKEIQIIHTLSTRSDEILERLANKFLQYDQPIETHLVTDVQTLRRFEKKDLCCHYIAAIRAMQERNWGKAWQEMETVYARRQNDPKIAERIAHAFTRFDRPNEACLWMDRYLKEAPDQKSFESANITRSHWARNANYKATPLELYWLTWLTCAENLYYQNDLENWKDFEHRFDRLIKNDADAIEYANKMLSSLRDPYTYLMSAKQHHADFLAEAESFIGIGVELSSTKTPGYLTIDNVFARTPAQRAGLKAGDTILAIAGRSCNNMPVSRFSEIARKHNGVPICLLIRRNNKNIKSYLIPCTVTIKSIEFKTLKPHVGLLTLRNFDSIETGKRIAKILANAKECSSLILDLRDNPGGKLNAALQASSVFIHEGPIATIEIRNRNKTTRYSHVLKADCDEIVSLVEGEKASTSVMKIPRCFQLPQIKNLIVLVNGNTGSAAEVLAAALQENGRALIVGTKTYGKGIGQTDFPIANGTVLRVTSARLLTPAGHFLGRGRRAPGEGLTPDIVVENNNDGTDAQLRTALAGLKN